VKYAKDTAAAADRCRSPISLAACCLGVITLALGGCAGTPAEQPYVETGKAATQVESADTLGIEVKGLRLSAAGYMLDFRYRVLDPVKAAPLLERKIQPYLLDEASGARLAVPDAPKVGRLRATSLADGQLILERAGEKPQSIALPRARFAHAEFIAELIERLRSDQPVPVPGEEAIAVWRIMEAAYRSCETGMRQRITA